MKVETTVREGNQFVRSTIRLRLKDYEQIKGEAKKRQMSVNGFMVYASLVLAKSKTIVT